MACQTCDHTMQSVAPYCYWCPRCGTLKHEIPNGADASCVKLYDRPKLVKHARKLLYAANALGFHQKLWPEWAAMAESCLTLKQRRTGEEP